MIVPLGKYQRGALLVLTMVMMGLVAMLGLSSAETMLMERKLASINRANQLAFEAAESALTMIEENIIATRFSVDNITNNSLFCGSICFDANCTNGFCFDGWDPGDWETCTLDTPVIEASEDAALWLEGSGKYQSVELPGNDFLGQALVEFRCYAALDKNMPVSEENLAWILRITVLATHPENYSRKMLRSQILLNPVPVSSPFEKRFSWEELDLPIPG